VTDGFAGLLHWDGPPRERQVIQGAAEGKTDRQIAKDLGISPETVATYWRRIRLRHGGSSRTEIVAALCMSSPSGAGVQAKAMEALMLRGVLDRLDPIFVENEEREVLAANKPLLKWLGLDPSVDWVGQRSDEIVERMGEACGGAVRSFLEAWPKQMGTQREFLLPEGPRRAWLLRDQIVWPNGDISQLIRIAQPLPAPTAIVSMASPQKSEEAMLMDEVPAAA
jgi:hypothetical protein